MGIERILLHMESENLLDRINPETPRLYIATMGDKARSYADKLAYALRMKGIWTETDILGRSIKAQFKYADKRGAEYVLTIGDNELDTGKGIVKCMTDGSQEECVLAEADTFFTEKFI